MSPTVKLGSWGGEDEEGKTAGQRRESYRRWQLGFSEMIVLTVCLSRAVG